jgi:hypothetical protein
VHVHQGLHAIDHRFIAHCSFSLQSSVEKPDSIRQV